ncbi:hypothetical protein ACOM2C_17150 [Pseudarthrobacter sp. So.54]
MRSVAKLTPGPIGVGTRWRAVLTSGTRATPLELEVTEYAPPERLGSVTRMDSADISGVLTFALEAAGTRMTWTWDVRPKGLLKLTAPLIAALGQQAGATNLVRTEGTSRNCRGALSRREPAGLSPGDKRPLPVALRELYIGESGFRRCIMKATKTSRTRQQHRVGG